MIQIPRSIVNHWIFYNPYYFRQWIALIFLAANEPGYTYIGKKKIPFERGEIVMSLRRLANQCNVDKDMIHVILKIFHEEKLIFVQKFKKYSIIKICDFDKVCPMASDNLTDNQSDNSAKKAATPIYKNIDSKYNIYNAAADAGAGARTRVKENQSLLSQSRFVNMKFLDEIVNNKNYMMWLADDLKISELQLDDLAVKFYHEKSAKDEKYISMQKCRNHFEAWCKYIINKQTNINSQHENFSSNRRASGLAAKLPPKPGYGLIED